MPKLDPAESAWARFLAGSVRSEEPLRRALRRTFHLAKQEGASERLCVVLVGPPASGKSVLLDVVRRLGRSLGSGAALEVHERELGHPGGARVIWQAVQQGPNNDEKAVRRRLRRRLRRTLDQREGHRADLVLILTKKPEERSGEIASAIQLIDVLAWATEKN